MKLPSEPTSFSESSVFIGYPFVLFVSRQSINVKSQSKKDASEAVNHNRLSKEVMDYLHAYSDGVNYFLEHEKETYRYTFLALPLEFTLVGHEPEPWQGADTLATLKLMCYIGNATLHYTTPYTTTPHHTTHCTLLRATTQIQ